MGKTEYFEFIWDQQPSAWRKISKAGPVYSALPYFLQQDIKKLREQKFFRTGDRLIIQSLNDGDGFNFKIVRKDDLE
jgi:hypothetical protein